jgi:TPR repeat protein
MTRRRARDWVRAACIGFCLVIGGCAAGSRGTTNRTGAEGSNATSGSSSVDAGAPRTCLHDAKDLFPCLEECDRGIASACNLIATRFEHGGTIPRDSSRAVFFHERACDLKDAASCVSAARMHAAGSGVPPSRTRQVELLRAACLLGEPLACSVPAKAYASGNGVGRDERRARDLFERACAGGIEAACDALGDAGAP